MSGRAVGGGAGVGCAVFSFVGLLAGVVLTVWLGSIMVGGVRGDDGDGKSPTTQTTDIVSLAHPSVPGAVPSTQEVTVQPRTGLTDEAGMIVKGKGFAPGPFELTVCLAHELRVAGGLAGCDSTTITSVTVDDSGAWTAGITARRVISIQGTSYDCAAFAEACDLVVSPPGQPDIGTSVHLSFTKGLPPVDAQRPPGGP